MSNKINSWFNNISHNLNLTVDELKNKVSWPTMEQLRESATIVLGASLVFSGILWGADFVIGKGITFFYSIFR